MSPAYSAAARATNIGLAEQRRGRAQNRRRKVFRSQAQARVSNEHDCGDRSRLPDVDPIFSQSENGESKNGKDQPHFLAQRAEQKRDESCGKKKRFVRASRATTAENKIESKKSERRRQGIGAARNVNDRRAVYRMNRPRQGDKKRDKPALSRFDFHEPKKFFREEKERDRGGGVTKQTGEMVRSRGERRRPRNRACR